MIMGLARIEEGRAIGRLKRMRGGEVDLSHRISREGANPSRPHLPAVTDKSFE